MLEIRTSSRKVVKLGPWSTVTKLDRREVDDMEVDVVLAHELIQVNVLLVEPPLLPLLSVVRGDTDVADTCFKLFPSTT